MLSGHVHTPNTSWDARAAVPCCACCAMLRRMMVLFHLAMMAMLAEPVAVIIIYANE